MAWQWKESETGRRKLLELKGKEDEPLVDELPLFMPTSWSFLFIHNNRFNGMRESSGPLPIRFPLWSSQWIYSCLQLFSRILVFCSIFPYHPQMRTSSLHSNHILATCPNRDSFILWMVVVEREPLGGFEGMQSVSHLRIVATPPPAQEEPLGSHATMRTPLGNCLANSSTIPGYVDDAGRTVLSSSIQLSANRLHWLLQLPLVGSADVSLKNSPKSPRIKPRIFPLPGILWRRALFKVTFQNMRSLASGSAIASNTHRNYSCFCKTSVLLLLPLLGEPILGHWQFFTRISCRSVGEDTKYKKLEIVVNKWIRIDQNHCTAALWTREGR